MIGSVSRIALLVLLASSAQAVLIDDRDVLLDSGKSLEQAIIDGDLSGGGSAHTIQDEGIALTNRSILNFTGSGIACSDTGTKTECVISGGGGGGALTDLTDVTLTSPAPGSVLIKGGGAGDWIDGQVDLADTDAVIGVLPDANIAATIARDAEVSAAYQPLNANLTDLADGTLTYSKVGGASASLCARFDGSGNLIAASGDCLAGDTGGGGISTVEENNSTVTSSATVLDFLGADFDVTGTTGESDVAVAAAIARDAEVAAAYLPLAGGTLTGNLVLSGDASEGVSGGGLADCDNGTTSKLLWDITTSKFSCGTDQGGSTGSDITLDLGDDSGNDSTGLTEIATSGDTNSIFTESAADKLLINAAADWPKADTADDLTCTNCIGPTEITDLTLSTDTAGNYVATVADGTGIDGTASAEGATYTPTLDLTEVTGTGTVWGAGAAQTWTFNTGTTDPVIDWGDGFFRFEAGPVRVGDAGTIATATGDGDLYVEDALEVDGAATIAGTLTIADPGDGSRGIDFQTNTSAIGAGASGFCKLGFVGTTLNKHCNGGSLTSVEGGVPDIDSVTGLGDIDTAFVFDGVDVDFETGTGDAFPRLLNDATPDSADCDAAGEAGRLVADPDADTDGSVFYCRGAAGWKDIDDDGGAGGFTSFNVDGDNNSPQTITDGNELLIAGGTNGIDTVSGATDTITLNLDLAESPAGGELGGNLDAPTIDDSVTVTGWTLGTSSATALTVPSLLSNTDVTVEVDADNNASESFQILDGLSAIVAEVTEVGALQIDGDFTSDGTGTSDFDGAVTAPSFATEGSASPLLSFDDTVAGGTEAQIDANATADNNGAMLLQVEDAAATYKTGLSIVSTSGAVVTKIGGDAASANHLAITEAGALTLAGTATIDGVSAGNIADLSAADTIAGNWVNTANPWADNEVSDTLTASISTLASANDNDTSIATTSFVQQELDDVDLLSDNCILENDGTPIPDSCVGDGTDDSAGAPAFSAITGATNTTAAMVVGTGASLATSGSGTIAATSVSGNTFTGGPSTFTGTSGQTYTFPTTTSTMARNSGTNVFTGIQTLLTGGGLTFNTTSSGTAALAGTVTLAGDSALAANGMTVGTTGFIAEGSSADGIELLLTFANPVTTDVTVTVPATEGTLAIIEGDLTTGSVLTTGAINTANLLAGTLCNAGNQVLENVDGTWQCTNTPAGGSESNTLTTVTTGITSGQIPIGTTAGGAVAYVALSACAADEKPEYVDGAPDTVICEAIGGLADADVSDTLTSSLFVGSGSSTTAVDLETAEVSGTLTVGKGGTGITALGTGVATWLGTPSSANLASAVTGETGSGALVFDTSPGFTTAANPVSNDGAALGTTALGWADLFLASGGTVHFANTDWVATHTTGILTVGTGDLRVTTAGTNTASAVTVGGTQTLTAKTLDAEGTGNVLTVPQKLWFPVAGCNNATASLLMDAPTTNAAAAACITGTNTQKGVADFDTTTDESLQATLMLPSDFTGAVDVDYKWLAAATTGSVTWCTQLICVADAETDDPAFPAQASGLCVSDAAKGTTLQTNDAADTGITATGCAAGELMHVRVSRDPDATAGLTDDMAGDARLIGFQLTLRRAM